MKFVGGFFMLFCFLLKGQEPQFFLNPTELFLQDKQHVNVKVRNYYRSGLNAYELGLKGLGNKFKLYANVSLFHTAEVQLLEGSIGTIAQLDKGTSFIAIGKPSETLGFRLYHCQRFKRFHCFFQFNHEMNSDEAYIGFGLPYRKVIWFSLISRYSRRLYLQTTYDIIINETNSLGFSIGLNYHENQFYYVRKDKNISFKVGFNHHQFLGLSPYINASI